MLARLGALTCGAIVALTAPSLAAPQPKFIGSWIVSSQKDAFTDESQDIAFTPDEDGQWFLAVRCLNKQPSMLVMASPKGDDEFVRSAVYQVKFRADKGAVDDLDALSLQDKGVEIILSPETFKKLESASTFALRLTTAKSDSTIDLVFNSKSGKTALNNVGNSCDLRK